MTVCQKYGWGTFQHELQAVMKSTTTETIERNVRLLEHICLAKPRKKEGGASSANPRARAGLGPGSDRSAKQHPHDWREEVDRADVLAGLARSLIVTGSPSCCRASWPTPWPYRRSIR